MKDRAAGGYAAGDFASMARGYGGMLMDAIFAHYIKYGRRPRSFMLHPTIKSKLLAELQHSNKSLYFHAGASGAPDTFAEIPIHWGGEIGSAWVLNCVNEYAEL